MIPRLQTVQHARACHGSAVLWSFEGTAHGPKNADELATLGLALASSMAEAEAEGERLETAVLRLQRRSDAAWAASVLDWVARHGRRPVVRTAVILPRPVVERLRTVGATVLLELAHHDPAMQRALVGSGSDAPAKLLLQAQHLRALRVPVATHLGPLLPGLHDEPHHIEPLLQHVAAADVRHVHLSVGQLGPGRLKALGGILPPGQLAGLMRSFGVAADAGAPPRRSGAGSGTASSWRLAWRLGPEAHARLYHSVRRIAQSYGLSVDVCGCPFQCHLDDSDRREYVAVRGPELFAS